MSLLGTLAKVAVEVAAEKSAGGAMNRQRSGRQANNGGLFGELGQSGQAPQQGGLEDLLGSVLGGGGAGSQGAGGGGGLGGLLEQLAGGGAGGGGGQSGGGLDSILEGLAGQQSGGGGLGDLLGSLARGQSGGRGGETGGGGGLGDLLGSLAGGQSGSGGGGGGLGDLLGGLLGGAQQQGGNGGGAFGDLLNQALQKRGEPDVAPTPQQEVAAGLMLRAMIQAAKSDGEIDAGERQKLLGKLGDVSREERDFVNNELQQPIDVQGLARQTPRGLEQQVYLMSVMGIDLDKQAEAEYLHQLATAMRLDGRQVNEIHDHLGVPRIYQ